MGEGGEGTQRVVERTVAVKLGGLLHDVDNLGVEESAHVTGNVAVSANTGRLGSVPLPPIRTILTLFAAMPLPRPLYARLHLHARAGAGVYVTSQSTPEYRSDHVR